MTGSKFFFIILACSILFVQTANALEWKEFSPQGSQCTILLPKEPNLCKTLLQSAVGPVPLYSVEAFYEGYGFALAFNDFPQPMTPWPDGYAAEKSLLKMSKGFVIFSNNG